MIEIKKKAWVHIYKMEGEPDYTGKEGWATFIDDAGQLHGTWGGLALNFAHDYFNYSIKEENEEQE